MDGHCLVYVTAPVDEARTLARTIVSRRLAACANVIPRMESVYWWNGNMETGDESVVIFKTRRTLAAALTDVVKAEHSYQCACVIVVPIEGGNADFLAWIDAETVPQPPG